MYIGTKLIEAEPMTHAAYNVFRGWALPAEENGDDKGYLVEYLDGGKPNVEGREGYVSWSPKEQFEAAYHPTTAMPFGLAIEAMRKGKKVARSGWNGKGMWITLSCSDSKMVKAEDIWAPHNREFAIANGGEVQVDPYFTMKTAQGTIQSGWLASQPDMLSEDWMIVE